MASKIFQELAKEKIDLFKTTFSNAKEIFWDEENAKLIHPGELGSYREAIVKDFIRLFIPQKYGLDSGFVVSPNNEISNQCDLIIFDIESTPSMQSLNYQKFFPIETILAVGEVKSEIQSKDSLSTSLIKLSKIKKMRENLKEVICIRRGRQGEYDPITYQFDQIFTFLICGKFNFSFNQLHNLYSEDILHRHRHNIILSISDGILLYYTGKMNYYYPYTATKIEQQKFIEIDDKEDIKHFIHFISGLIMGVKLATILSPDMGMYLTDDIFFVENLGNN